MKALKKIPTWAWVLGAAGLVAALLLRRKTNYGADLAPAANFPGAGLPASNGAPAGQPRQPSQEPWQQNAGQRPTGQRPFSELTMRLARGVLGGPVGPGGTGHPGIVLAFNPSGPVGTDPAYRVGRPDSRSVPSLPVQGPQRE